MKVLCIGKTLLDVVVKGTRRIPPRYLASMVDSIEIAPGGGAALTAEIFQRLGHDVTLLSCIGADLPGTFVQLLLEEKGLNTDSLVASAEFSTLKNVVAVDEYGSARYIMLGDRALPSAFKNASLPSGSEFDLIHLSTVDQLLDDHGEPFETWLRQLRSTDSCTVVSADTSKVTKYAGRTATIIGYVDYLFGNYVELRALAETVAASYKDEVGVDNATRYTPSAIMAMALSLGARKAVVMKLGGRGSAYFASNANQHVSAYEVPSVANENGAGDVFCAAVLDALCAGRSIPIALERGNQIAAIHISLPERFSACDLTNDASLCGAVADWRRSAQVEVDTTWWRFPQAVMGYGERFDVTRELSNRELDAWIDVLRTQGLVSRESRVLDAGCGTGRFALPIQNQIGCSVVGVDVSEEMLRVARSKSVDIDWRLADLANLDDVLDDMLGKFDCVWVSSVVNQILESLTDVLSQIHAQLRPNGRLLVRFVSRELIKSMSWMTFFPKARTIAYERCPRIGTIISYLQDTGFVLREVQRLDFVDKLPVDQFCRRMAHRGNIWLSAVSDEELKSCLSRVRKATGKNLFEYHRPKYLVVVEKAP